MKTFITIFFASILSLSMWCQNGMKINNLASGVGALICDSKVIGSGFLIEHDSVLFIVSAKHVFEHIPGESISYETYPNGKSNGEVTSISVAFGQVKNTPFYHESETSDVALLVVGYQKSAIEYQMLSFVEASSTLPHINRSENLILLDDVWFSQEVVTVGFPSSLSINDPRLPFNRPLAVDGILSGFSQNNKIIARLAVFGGNSGGPVYSIISQRNNSDVTPYLGLVGLVVEYIPSLNAVFQNDNGQLPITTNSGYALLEPSDEILRLLNEFSSFQ